MRSRSYGVILDLVVGEPERLPGGRDVALDRRASSSLAFGRTENCSRTAGHAAPTRTLDSTSSATRDRRQLQVAQEDADEERHRADHRDEQQDQLRRHHRVQIGVGGTGEQVPVAVGEQQRVPVEPVGDRLEQDERPARIGKLDPGRDGELPAAAGQPHPAEEVVRDQRAKNADRHRDEQPVEHQR